MVIGRDVLVVEDDAATRALLAALTQHYGFNPVLVADGATALGQLAARRFDIILMDLLLPGTNGFELLRHLKCTRPEMLSRTIVMTAATDATTQHCSELHQVWKFLRKPLEIEDLATHMLACIDDHAQRSRTSDLEVRSLVPGNDAAAR